MNSSNNEFMDKVAIIGMVCRFPGANDTAKYWDNLCNGVDSVISFMEEELEASGLSKEMYQRENYVNAKGYLDYVDLFDAEFFDMNPREAIMLDPQHRIYLECANEALENAGYNPENFNGRIAVYSGVDANTYMINNLLANEEALNSIGELEHMLSDKDYISTRVSYKLNLKGPSFAVQCACSSSMVAVHLAAESLLSGESDMALAGGISISFPEKAGYFHEEGGIVSPNGKCKAFDEKADGTIYGNGAGIVVLKRMEDAVRDNDTIHAVILGTAVNNDGAVKVGFTAPGIESQTSVISEAIRLSNVDFESVSYIETHGTGTKLGDAIELTALEKAFHGRTNKKKFCAIGSVKSNIGHLSTAAGVASLIKTVLMLENKKLPPSLHFKTPNPIIDFENSPFYVNTKLKDWDVRDYPRRAGVSSFGLGGTNVHIVMEEPPVLQADMPKKENEIILLSAKSSNALADMEENLLEFLKNQKEDTIHNLAYTLQVGRRAYPYRKTFTAADRQEIMERLEDKQTGNEYCVNKNSKQVVFVFSGFGEQYSAMAFGLYEKSHVFRKALDHCFASLKNRTNQDYKKLWLEADNSKLTRPSVAYPLLFSVEYALAKMLLALNVHPSIMIGHSIGEYVCACIAGVMTAEDGLYLVYERGRLIETLPEGAMLTIMLNQEETEKHLIEGTSLAAVNSVNICGVSGEPEKIKELKKNLLESQVACISVDCKYAFHSYMMEQISDKFLATLNTVELKAPKIPFISNVTGTYINEEASQSSYWVKHLKSTVNFYKGIQTICEKESNIFIEVGPGKILGSFVRQIIGIKEETQKIVYIIDPEKEQKDDYKRFLSSAGEMWCHGIDIDMNAFFKGKENKRIPIPTYPFQRKRYFVEPERKMQLTGGVFYDVWKQEILGEISLENRDEQNAVMIIGIEQESIWGMGDILNQHGIQTVSVLAGEEWKIIDMHHYSIRLSLIDDYITVFQQVLQNMLIIKHVIILPDAQKLIENFQINCLMNLMKAVSFIEKDLLLKITLMTQNSCQITGSEEITTQSSMIELAQVAEREYKNISCRIIDRDENATSSNIMRALYTKHDFPLIGIRGNIIWVRDYGKLKKQVESKFHISQNGTYLLINGLNNEMLLLGEVLGREYNCRLIFVEIQGKKPEQEIMEKYEKIRRQYPNVSLYTSQEEIREQGEKVCGIFHFMKDDERRLGISEIDIEKELRQVKQMQEELEFLNNMSDEDQVEFIFTICPYSRETIQIGECRNALQTIYAFTTIANFAMKNWYFVHFPFSLYEKEAMKVNMKMVIENLMMLRLYPSQYGYSIFPFHPESIRQMSRSKKPDQTEMTYERPKLDVEYVESRNELDQKLTEIWHQVLGFSDIGIRDGFFHLGGNSLLALQIVFKISKELHVEIAMADFIQNPTIEYLSDYISSILWLNGNQMEQDDELQNSSEQRKEFEI